MNRPNRFDVYFGPPLPTQPEGQTTQQGMPDGTRALDSQQMTNLLLARVESQTYNSPQSSTEHGDPHMMLSPREPSGNYLMTAVKPPKTLTMPDQKLVILDLNGTLLVRPDAKKSKKSEMRPNLRNFLKYLFNNFTVMVWSSARGENVRVLAENNFGEYRSRLIAIWAREEFGLSESDYHNHVQVYKDLEKVWRSSAIQRHHQGGQFGQANTILIDDSAIKAWSEPWNLVEVPTFVSVQDESTKGDILAQVAGYLEQLRMQEDVSKFIHKMPFKANGKWNFNWAALTPQPGPSNQQFALPFRGH